METSTSTFLQFFLVILISVLISFKLFVFASVFVLSSGLFSLMGTIKNPVAESFIYGGVFGILHGMMTGFFIYWRQPHATGASFAVSSFYAMEITLLITFVIFLVKDHFEQPPHLRFINSNMTADGFYISVYLLVTWFTIATVIFLIPAAAIGIINKSALNLLPESLHLNR